jgi:hypothetical protein
MRLVAAGLAPVALFGAVGVACLDPKQDFNDWLALSADARAPEVVESGTLDAVPDGGFTGAYVMACVNDLVPGVANATVFVAQLTFTEAGGAGNGTFDFSNTPLIAHATDTSMTAGMATTVKGSKVTAGKCDVTFGMTTIPAAANPSGSGTIVFSDSVLHFQIASSTQVCANLNGHLTMPIMATLDQPDNYCAFKPAQGTSVPMFTMADFHCP